jgi:hypothetical protein
MFQRSADTPNFVRFRPQEVENSVKWWRPMKAKFLVSVQKSPDHGRAMGIGNRQDHFVLPPGGRNTKPAPLSGPLVISNLPPADRP